MWTNFTSIKKYYIVKLQRAQVKKALFNGVWQSHGTQKTNDKARGCYTLMVSKARRQRQREKRREKRRLMQALKKQNAAITERAPISKYKLLNQNFYNYAVNKTMSEIRNGNIESEREALLKKVVGLRTKLKPIKRRV